MANKYRKKPVVIEAMQYDGKNALAILEWAKWGEVNEDVLGGLEIPAPEGTTTAKPGDWVIRGIDGNFYACPSATFDATYEPAE